MDSSGDSFYLFDNVVKRKLCRLEITYYGISIKTDRIPNCYLFDDTTLVNMYNEILEIRTFNGELFIQGRYRSEWYFLKDLMAWAFLDNTLYENARFWCDRKEKNIMKCITLKQTKCGLRDATYHGKVRHHDGNALNCHIDNLYIE